ncbi:MAG: 3-phosphoshikimate 1-carboxyvinyltransferase, partial [Akkermansiaceae bacterium]|nr:3-phosphoshikimate 1-carboxyvinyltransferase [Akkermansiaceae bacterium]
MSEEDSKSVFRVSRIDRFQVELEVPGDKSMSHRAAMIGGLASGTSTITGFLPSEDCVNTLQAMVACGVGCEVLEELPGYGPVAMRLSGKSMRLSAPAAPLDCGNSGTGMRLLAGLLAGQEFGCELFGDASLSSRPM